MEDKQKTKHWRATMPALSRAAAAVVASMPHGSSQHDVAAIAIVAFWRMTQGAMQGGADGEAFQVLVCELAAHTGGIPT